MIKQLATTILILFSLLNIYSQTIKKDTTFVSAKRLDDSTRLIKDCINPINDSIKHGYWIYKVNIISPVSNGIKTVYDVTTLPYQKGWYINGKKSGKWEYYNTSPGMCKDFCYQTSVTRTVVYNNDGSITVSRYNRDVSKVTINRDSTHISGYYEREILKRYRRINIDTEGDTIKASINNKVFLKLNIDQLSYITDILLYGEYDRKIKSILKMDE